MILLQPEERYAEEYMRLAETFDLKFELMNLAFEQNLKKPEIPAQLRQRYEKYLYSCHGVFADINYSGSDSGIFRESVDRIRQCIEAGKSMGISKYVFHFCFHPVLRPDDPLYELWSHTFADLFTALADEYDADFYMENVLDVSPQVLKNMMETAQHPRLHICLDVGHAHFSSTPIADWVRELASYITYIHLSDNHGVYDEHLAIGDGTIDFIQLK